MEPQITLENLLNLQSIGVMYVTAAGEVQFVNEVCEDIFSASLEEIRDRSIWKTFREADKKEVLHALTQTGTFEEVHLGIKGYCGRFSAVKPDSELEGFFVFLIPLGSVASLFNEQMDPQDFFVAKSMEAIGKAASKFGHDFNNLLGSIRGCVDLMNHRLKKLFPEEIPVQRQLDIIASSVEKAVEITGKMRGYVRPGAPYLEKIKLSDVIEQVLDILNKTCEIEFESDVNVVTDPEVEICEFMILQMLVSVLSNSIEALEDMDERMVVFYLDALSHEGNDDIGLLPGRYARLSIMDHGKGIAEQAQEKLFQPFFSTKYSGIGKGLGLSLTMSKAIMKKHSGVISIASVPHGGTIVHLYFPLSDELDAERSS